MHLLAFKANAVRTLLLKKNGFCLVSIYNYELFTLSITRNIDTIASLPG